MIASIISYVRPHHKDRSCVFPGAVLCWTADFANLGVDKLSKIVYPVFSLEAEDPVMSTQRRFSYYFTLYGFCDTGCLRCAA